MLADALVNLPPAQQIQRMNDIIRTAVDTPYFELVKYCLDQIIREAQHFLSRGWDHQTTDGMLRTHSATLSVALFLKEKLLEETQLPEEFNYTEEPHADAE